MKKMELNIQLFAVNLTTQSLTEVSYDVASNTSQVRYLVQLTTTGSSYNNNNITTTYYIDGVQYTSTHKLPRTTTTTIVDRTVTITHNNDGTRSVSASFSCPTDISAGTITGSTSTQLTTIPRASSVFVADTYIESSAIITINRASNNFKHTLLYSFGSLSGIIAQNVDTSYGWTVPSTFYDEIPNSKSGTCTITCITYNNDTEIGRKTTTFIASTEKLRCEPTVSAQATDTRNRTVRATGNSSIIIRHESQVTIGGTVTAKKSATLTHLYVNGVEVVMPSGSTTYNYQLTNLTVEIEDIRVRVIDSRGYDVTLVSPQTVIQYFEPTINLDVKRTAPTTGEVSAMLSGNFFNQSFGEQHNDMTITWSYKKTTDSTWINGGTLTEDVDYTLDGDTYYSGIGNEPSYISLGSVFDYRYAYDIQFIAEDMFGYAATIKQVTKGIPIINWDDEHFNINGQITINEEDLLDYIRNNI